MSLPLVSCIMPTYGRPDYVAESLRMFLAQDYPSKELVILNDCPGQVFLGDFAEVKIVNTDTRWQSLGAKRNAAIEMANGEYIAVWDDDDVYLPWRLSHSIRHMDETKSPFYCPATFWAYWGEETLHENHAVRNWIGHPAHMFRKDLWATIGGYPDQTNGEDIGFLMKLVDQLAGEWPRDTIARWNQFLVMRGSSKYSHTSISGGRQGPDTDPKEILLQPDAIDDPVLRSVSERLIRQHEQVLRRQQILQQRALEWPGLPSGIDRQWLDQWEPQFQMVGYQTLGKHGDLGYEGRRVEISGVTFPHAISAHAPSRLKYSLSGNWTHFCCQVALNDDVSEEASGANFMVYADGQLRGIARNVQAGSIPRLLTAQLDGACELELVIQYLRSDYCHSVWCDPFLVSLSEAQRKMPLTDCLERAEITIPEEVPRSELCIATVGSPGFEEWIDDLFGSICANSQLPNALLVIYSYGDSKEIRCVAEKYGASIIPCRPLKPLNCAANSVMYSVTKFISAEKYICIDADMLVLDDLRPILAALDATPLGKVLACREGVWAADLGDAIQKMYSGSAADIDRLVSTNGARECSYPLIVNDGMFAGTFASLSALDDSMRGLDNASDWLDDRIQFCPWANQFLLNLILAQCQSGVELAPRFNVQLNSQSVDFQTNESGIVATTSESQRAAVVHFNGGGKTAHSDWRGRYRAISKP